MFFTDRSEDAARDSGGLFHLPRGFPFTTARPGGALMGAGGVGEPAGTDPMADCEPLQMGALPAVPRVVPVVCVVAGGGPSPLGTGFDGSGDS
jgi:hypothetical protein